MLSLLCDMEVCGASTCGAWTCGVATIISSKPRLNIRGRLIILLGFMYRVFILSESISDIQHDDRVPYRVTASLCRGPSASDGHETQILPTMLISCDVGLIFTIWHEAGYADFGSIPMRTR
jgi:hypothetical protein